MPAKSPKTTSTTSGTTPTPTTTPPTTTPPVSGGGGGLSGASPQTGTSVGPVDPGISGGRTTLSDFAQSSGGDLEQAEIEAAQKKVEQANKMSLAEMAASFGSARAGEARSEREMLAAVASGALPRFVCRVSPRDVFDAGLFSWGSAKDVIYATEPADLMGVGPIAALAKVGWTKEWVLKSAGKEIAVCIYDTEAMVDKKKQTKTAPNADGKQFDQMVEADGSGTQVSASVGEMNWSSLRATAMGDRMFTAQMKTAGARDQATLDAVFDVLVNTPVRAAPNTSDPKLAELCEKARDLLEDLYSANSLFTGMGATMLENGALGSREVTVNNEGSGFEVKPGVNAEIISLGSFTETDAQTFFSSIGV